MNHVENSLALAFEYKPCKPDFFRRFMKKHKKADVSNSINPVPITPTTNKMYGLWAFVALLLGVMTLGSIGDGVDGPVKWNTT